MTIILYSLVGTVYGPPVVGGIVCAGCEGALTLVPDVEGPFVNTGGGSVCPNSSIWHFNLNQSSIAFCYLVSL